jgi:predicted transcriptional regulator with HTH domain
MQNEKEETLESPELIKPLVIRALRRSNVRKKIAKHLFDISPSGNYISNIAYQVNTTPTNVIGAIRGLNNRYKKDANLY